jgi:acyl-coenzyme A synthetase/AMP-(fatty) acid ligase
LTTVSPEAPAAWAELTPAATALRQVARDDPDRVALEVGERRVSYAALNADVDALAQRLLDEHGTSHPVVGMRLKDPHAMTTATLAVQRAGMVAVPIDPTAPVDRVLAVLGEIDPIVLLSDIDGDGDALPLRVEHPHRYVADAPAGDVIADPGEIAAVVFTSGSTGIPKGIIMSTEQRKNAARITREVATDYELGDRFGAITVGTVGFADGLVHSAITFGFTLVAYEIRDRGLSEFADWLLTERVSLITLVPTIWRFLAPELPADLIFPDLRMVTLAGETSTWEDVASMRRHLSSTAVVSNMFGLTEVMISRFDIRSDMPIGTGPLPAGTPFPERTVMIVDPDGNPVPDGVSGEIVVDSRTSALGYWRQPDATARVFTELPDGRRRVRTGDGGRMLPDGTLEHLGRLDHVVKVAGNRIELGDVESALRSLPGVAHAAATTYTSANDEIRLVAFAVPAPGASLHPALLRSALARRLPSVMVPDAVHLLDEVPQLPGGKINRGALPDRAGVRPEDDHLASATTELERVLVDIWREVLGLSSVGIHDDFFALGGDSLRAARVFAEIERRLGLDRAVALILEAPTVSALASVLEHGSDSWQAVVPLQLTGSRPPLIVIHDGRGDVFYAQRLVPHLGPEQPVYGLLPPSPSIEDRRETSIEELATTYVERIRGLRPHGPYLFYGYSLGGTIALEMGRQLTVAGEDVLLVGLGDSIGPGHPGVLPPRRSELSRRRMLTLRAQQRTAAMKGMSGAQALGDILGVARRQLQRWVAFSLLTARRLWSRVSGGAPPLAPRAPYERLAPTNQAFFEWHAELGVNYVPATVIAGDVLLLRAVDYDTRSDRGWGPFVGGELTTVDIVASHEQLHAPENTPGVGAALRQAIDRVLASA